MMLIDMIKHLKYLYIRYFNKSKVESLVISELGHKDISIDYLMNLREPFITKRNKILNNPFLYYNPFYRKRLRRIDAKLDTIDILIRTLQSQTK